MKNDKIFTICLLYNFPQHQVGWHAELGYNKLSSQEVIGSSSSSPVAVTLFTYWFSHEMLHCTARHPDFTAQYIHPLYKRTQKRISQFSLYCQLCWNVDLRSHLVSIKTLESYCQALICSYQTHEFFSLDTKLLMSLTLMFICLKNSFSCIYSWMYLTSLQ